MRIDQALSILRRTGFVILVVASPPNILWRPASGVDVMGEIYDDDRTKPWLGTGVRWQATRQFSADASYSVRRETPRIKLWTAGFKVAF